ncbi:MAG: hypothetical protein GWN30_06720, partial [Gammaproteobacteria bacterium]|nr:hypothetical protein [Gammaproteobacteria bacterium]
GYLRRFIHFCLELFAQEKVETIQVSTEINDFTEQIFKILEQFKDKLKTSFNDKERRDIMDSLGQAGSEFRWHYYENGLSGTLSHIAR